MQSNINKQYDAMQYKIQTIWNVTKTVLTTLEKKKQSNICNLIMECPKSPHKMSLKKKNVLDRIPLMKRTSGNCLYSSSLIYIQDELCGENWRPSNKRYTYDVPWWWFWKTGTKMWQTVNLRLCDLSFSALCRRKGCSYLSWVLW